MRGYVKNSPETVGNLIDFGDVEIPDSLDRRQLGEVNPVKDQGDCGSCWAFGTIAAMESAYKRSKGELLSFSE